MDAEPLSSLPGDAIVLHDGWEMRESALKSLHVQFSHIDKGVQVISTLDRGSPVNIKATVMTTDRKMVGSRSWQAIVEAGKSLPVGDLADLPADGPSDAEVPPSFWSDNALTPMPGETAEVEVRARRSLPPETPQVVAKKGMRLIGRLELPALKPGRQRIALGKSSREITIAD